MHEATTAFAISSIIERPLTGGRGPEEGKALVSRHCAPIVFHFDLSRLYTTAATWKNASLSNEQTLSPSREERWPSSNGHNASYGNLSPSSRAPLAFSLPPRFQRMWVNREMDNLDEFYPEGGKGMTLTSIDFKFVKKRSRSELSNLSLPNIGPFEFLLNETTFIANDCIQRLR